MAWSLFSAQITLPPRLVKFSSKSSSCLSSVSMARHFTFLALSLARCTLANCSLPLGTTALYLPILKLIFRLCSRSAAFTVLLAINVSDCSDINYLITSSCLPIFVNASMALSKCLCSCAALNCTLILAWPLATTGKKKPIT